MKVDLDKAVDFCVSGNYVIAQIEEKRTKNGDGLMLVLHFINEDNAFSVKEYFLIEHPKQGAVNMALLRLKEVIQFAGLESSGEFDVNQLLGYRFQAQPYKDGEFHRIQLLANLGKSPLKATAPAMSMEDVPF